VGIQIIQIIQIIKIIQMISILHLSFEPGVLLGEDGIGGVGHGRLGGVGAHAGVYLDLLLGDGFVGDVQSKCLGRGFVA